MADRISGLDGVNLRIGALLCALTALAAVVRVVGLDSSLWYDEITTLLRFVRLPVNELVANFSSLNNHPFYSLAANLSVAAFGESAASLRLPAAFFGVASIIAFFPVARRVVDLKLALLTVTLIAVSYHHVWFSQNARGYTMLLFWTTIATLLFLAGAKRNDVRIWTAYGAVFAAAMYTHLSAAFYFATHGLIYGAFLCDRAINHRENSMPLAGPLPFVGMSIGVVLTFCAYGPMLGDMEAAFNDVRGDAGGAALAQWNDPLFVASNLAGQLLALGPLMAIALPPTIFLIAVGVRAIWRAERLLAAIYLLQIPITVAVLASAGMRIWPRYFFVEISFLYLALVAGAAAVSTYIGGILEEKRYISSATPFIMMTIAAAMLTGSLTLLTHNYEAPKQDLAGAVAVVERTASPTDIRAVYGVAAQPVIEYYSPTWVELMPETLKLASRRRVWAIVAFRDQVKASDPTLWSRFERVFTLYEKRGGTLGGGDVYIYVSAPLQDDGSSEKLQARARLGGLVTGAAKANPR